MKELPYRLRIELSVKIYRRMVEGVPFLHEGRSSDFIAYVGPMLRTLRFREGQFLYHSKDPVLESNLQSSSKSHL